jgi:large subunit ribosomal protein L19
MNQLIESIEADQLKTDIPDFKVGDTISVHYRIIEGSKERIQLFTGTVIGRRGRGISESILIYRVAYGSAMERMIPLHSPRVAKIEVIKRGKVRRGKLYHLRGVFGKKAKIQERIVKAEAPKAAAEKPAPAPEKKEAPEKEEE